MEYRHRALNIKPLNTDDIEFTDIFMLGTVKNPHWRCKAHTTDNRFRTGYCFGDTEDKAKAAAVVDIIKQFHSYSGSHYPRSQYADVMWM